MSETMSNNLVGVAESLAALSAYRALTPAEIKEAMRIAYETGKADGAVETCDKLMATEMS